MKWSRLCEAGLFRASHQRVSGHAVPQAVVSPVPEAVVGPAVPEAVVGPAVSHRAAGEVHLHFKPTNSRSETFRTMFRNFHRVFFFFLCY